MLTISLIDFITLLIITQGPGAPKKNLRRVTVMIDDPSEGQFLSGAIRALKSIDLIAGRPTSEKALTFLCESADVDIISLDLGGRLAFQLSRKQVHTMYREGKDNCQLIYT